MAEQGELDFALLSTTQELLNMQTRSISREDLVVVGHRDTLADRLAPSGAELANYKLVLPSRHKSLRNLIDAQFGLHGLTLRPNMEIDVMQSLLHQALRPGWLSIVPSTTLLPEIFGAKLVEAKLEQPLIRRNVGVAWPRHKALDPAMYRFIGVLSETLLKVPGLELVADSAA
ncbi:substrate-binding domain-containing protein [Pigmentiphaga litoralis]|uniref:substrate-binding domain-containing protein n=1 Tax=Pigmentiphaga litoralis TaxID=516702 RepID=UPI003899B8B3